MSEIYITDLIDVSLLQRLQDAFSKSTGLAAQITDAEGVPVTKGSGYTKYCMELTRKSEEGHLRCEKCGRMGAERTLKSGKAEAYKCHSGLTDFAAPIMVQDTLVGCIVGGQALTEEPDRELCDKVAEEIGVDKDEYWEALKDVQIMSAERIQSAADFLFESASVLSDIAYGKYLAIENSKEMMKVAAMKSDFVANVSHEIRTPLNAIIGMTELVLREELSPSVREYADQIKTSGNALLSIINDLLDFSKIETGAVSIIPEKYELMSIIHDVTNILMNTRENKNVDLYVAMDPTLPRYFLGDSLRIKQVLLNIANNALRFTKQGYVEIEVGYSKIDDGNVMLNISVADTGIGIKEEDFSRIFESFHTIDSKRNRSAEGAGLGLAIVKQLLNLMGGDIYVESEVGKGSRFWFEIPQKVHNPDPSINIKNPAGNVGICLFEKAHDAEYMVKESKRFGFGLKLISSPDELKAVVNEPEIKGKRLYFFTDEGGYNNGVKELSEKHKDIIFAVITEYDSQYHKSADNVVFIKKPMSTISMDIALATMDRQTEKLSNAEAPEFTAPSAKILIVDDSLVNLKVASKLLKPLNMQITTAIDGMKALDAVATDAFDIVFMDHMMPEMDGLETTRIIRRLHPELAGMPIIALTANAVGGAREMFLREGMDDFVAKPIEIKKLIQVVKKWLPEEKIIMKGADE